MMTPVGVIPNEFCPLVHLSIGNFIGSVQFAFKSFVARPTLCGFIERLNRRQDAMRWLMRMRRINFWICRLSCMPQVSLYSILLFLPTLQVLKAAKGKLALAREASGKLKSIDSGKRRTKFKEKRKAKGG